MEQIWWVRVGVFSVCNTATVGTTGNGVLQLYDLVVLEIKAKAGNCIGGMHLSNWRGASLSTLDSCI